MAKTLHVRINSMPDPGGSPISDTEAQINGTGSVSIGATAPGDYPLAGAAVGDDVAIRAVNSGGALDFAGLATKTVPGLAPEALTAPSISGSAVPDSTVTIVPGTYDGAPSPTLTYTATLDGVDVTADLAGLDYTIPTGATAGEVFEVVETAANGYTPNATQTTTATVQATTFTLNSLFSGSEQGAIYDPRNLTGLTAGVDNITTLSDETANGNDASQATAADQLLYDEAGGVVFGASDGTSDYMSIPTLPLQGDMTVLFAVRNEVQTAGDSFLRPLLSAENEQTISTSDTGHYTMGLTRSEEGDATFQIREDLAAEPITFTQITGAVNPDGNFMVLAFRRSGTTAEIYKDGTLIATGTMNRTTGFPTTNYALLANPYGGAGASSSRYALTDLAGFCAINRALTPQELSDATTEIGSWAGLTV